MEIRERNRALKAKTIAQYIEKCNEGGAPAYQNREDYAWLTEKVTASAARKSAEQEAREKLNSQNAANAFHPGMELVIAGVIGKYGTAFLGKYKKEALLKTLPKAFTALSEKAPFTETKPQPQEEAPAAAFSWEIGEGGMYRTLNELAADTGRGFFIDYTKVPVSQVTIEFCEVFEIDPWQLFSGDCRLYAVERASDLVRKLESEGIPCAAVGMLTGDNDKAICHRETRSLLNRPQPDELLKILKEELREETKEESREDA